METEFIFLDDKVQRPLSFITFNKQNLSISVQYISPGWGETQIAMMMFRSV